MTELSGFPAKFLVLLLFFSSFFFTTNAIAQAEEWSCNITVSPESGFRGTDPTTAFEKYKAANGLPAAGDVTSACHGASLNFDDKLNGVRGSVRNPTYEDVEYFVQESYTKVTACECTGSSCTVTASKQISYPWDAFWRCSRPLAVATSITLSGPTETRPVGTGGTSEITLIAKVTDGTNPKPGVALSFAVDVTAKSGGHDHDDSSRPKGTLSIASGTTNANGEVKLTFKASQVAGVHTVKATCTTCSTTVIAKEIQVKVPELLALLTLPFRDAQWAYPGIGQVPGRHSDNHYLTIAAVTRLLGISQKFNAIWPNAPRLTLNDASLPWGGKFDIPATWERNPLVHNEHRLGDNIDVRANAAPGAVPANIRDAVFRWLRKASRVEDNIPPEFVIESVNPLREGIGTQNEHFHLRLGN
jgi:hypothetical protein